MTKVDIISGFLGAGKTTFIKQLIDQVYAGEKLVLIENEFGEIGIDGGFLKDAGIEITEMNSGCICCTLVGDFSKALQKVLDQYQPDRVLIEPSGVGKLSDIVKAIENIKEEADIEITGRITVVDGKKAKVYMKNFGEFFKDQVEHASTIVLSRTQMMTDEKIEECVHLLREENAEAAIISTPWDQLGKDAIMRALEHGVAMERMIEEARAQKHAHDERDHECCGHNHDDHNHECCGHGHDEHDHECCGRDHDEHDYECCDHEHHHDHECCGHDHDDHDHDHQCCGHDHHDHDHGCCGHEHHHDHDHECCGHDHDDHDHECCGHDHHDHDHGCCGHEHHHDRDHDHHHDHGHDCGCHDHHDHHHHHADEVFTSWGKETAHKYTEEELDVLLNALSETQDYGTILRSKGIIAMADGSWKQFDLVPEEYEVREGQADYAGRVCVIGTDLKEDELLKLFHI